MYILILPIEAIPHYCHTYTRQKLTQGGSGEKGKRREKVFRSIADIKYVM